MGMGASRESIYFASEPAYEPPEFAFGRKAKELFEVLGASDEPKKTNLLKGLKTWGFFEIASEI